MGQSKARGPVGDHGKLASTPSMQKGDWPPLLGACKKRALSCQIF